MLENADEMAQLVSVPATEPSDLNSIPGSYVVNGQNRCLQVVF